MEAQGSQVIQPEGKRAAKWQSQDSNLDLSDSKANPPSCTSTAGRNLEKAEEAVKSHLLHQGTGQLQATVAPSCKELTVSTSKLME